MSHAIHSLLATTAERSVSAPAGRMQPALRLAVLTCMDARIDPLAALGIGVGDAHVLRNAGGRVIYDVGVQPGVVDPTRWGRGGGRASCSRPPQRAGGRGQ